MDRCYEVTYGKEIVGKVQLLQQGLYYRVLFRCRLSGDAIYRLYAIAGSHQENLGVPVPDADGFVLDRLVPVKRFGSEPIRFILSAGKEVCDSHFVPITPEEPFSYIEQLKNSFLQTEHGKVGIQI